MCVCVCGRWSGVCGGRWAGVCVWEVVRCVCVCGRWSGV